MKTNNKKLLEDIEKNGFISNKVDSSIDLIFEINKLKKEKNAILLAHYYQRPEIQDIADFIGDSLELSKKAANTNADLIIFSGVHFMAENAKILSPHKKVIIPDIKAGCSLADSCNYDDFKKFIDKYPNRLIVTYVNTSAKIKALSHITCTSSNALDIIKGIPEKNKIIFAPDKNLGNYISNLVNRDMIIWNGACHVHEEFSVEKIIELKKQHSNAKIIAHPECKKPVLLLADFIGSTTKLLEFTKINNADTFIVATEPGVIHQMKKANPNKIFIPALPTDSTCGCIDCEYMKLTTIEKIYNCLKYELPEVTIEPEILEKAQISIKRMIDWPNVNF